MSQATASGMERDVTAALLLREDALARYREVRAVSEALCRPLETFLLGEYLPAYRPFHPQFRILFNSYYEQVGPYHPRPQRGLLSRPTVDEVYRYRAWVDSHMEGLIAEVDEALWPQVALRITIGLNHEQQHQELLLTDIKHNFWVNPLLPAYRRDLSPSTGEAAPFCWQGFDGGLSTIGHGGDGFAYDNEQPRHTVYVPPYRLANRLVTNDEYLTFIADDGYHRPELWLSDGWSTVQRGQWQAPLYWINQGGQWLQFSLAGLLPLNGQEPVAHLSYYEADAYARWAGHRLPTEQEWETGAVMEPLEGGRLRNLDHLHPGVADGEGMQQLFGDLWEWTASAYGPYPGYRAPAGAIGEYNGKFMCNQMVLRGGSCATPGDHIRVSYRNFFYPNERWQFTGLRLADDGAEGEA
jgi:ergothioneine biosynthesis protein EgtB